MEITEQVIHLLAKVATEVQARFTDFSDLAHGFEHTHRVYHLAMHDVPRSWHRSCWRSLNFPMIPARRSSRRSWRIVIVVTSSLRRLKRVYSMTRITWTAWGRVG